MSSKADVPNKTDFLKYSVSNFIENERFVNEVQKHPPGLGSPKQTINDVIISSCSNLSTLSSNKDNEETKYTTSQPRYSPQKENLHQTGFTDMQIVPGRFSPKRYVTTCFLKPINVPYWHSETISLTLGSTKKKYHEHTFVKTKLTPAYWSENMTTEIPDKERKLYKSVMEIPVEKSEFHYISLLPQQELAAAIAV